MHSIPESVSRAELVEAMKPLLNLLAVRFEDLYGNIEINFMEGSVALVHAVPADAVEIKAVRPEANSSNASSVYAAVTQVRLTAPEFKHEPLCRDVRVEEGQV